jgi:hypothetical protein
MMRTGTSLLALLLITCVGSATAAEPARARHGFLVFSPDGVTSYTQDAKGKLRLQGKMTSGSIDEFATRDGRIYHLHMLLGRVTELGADLKPLREVTVKSRTDVPYWLGAWNNGLLVLNNNAVVYLDVDLKQVALLQLQPRRHDDITPALNPQDFDIWEQRGYLLANTGELFIIPLDLPTSVEPLAPALRADDGYSPDAQWIDPADKTLNIIGKTQREEHDAQLKPGEFRIIKEQIVYTYELDDFGAAPLHNVVHEERLIHEPVRLDFDDGEHPDGMVIERRPPYRPDGPAQGTYIGVLSRTTPAYAEAFEETEDMGLPDRAIVRLKSRGRYDKQELFRETREGPLWFKSELGARYIEGDLQEHVLRLQPAPYGKLKALPELRGVYFKALAY